MKEKAIKKINSMGKVVGILAIIAQVFTCIAFVGCLIGAIAVAVIPNDFIKIQTRGDISVSVDMSKFDYHFTDTDRQKIQAELDKSFEEGSGKIQINGQTYGQAKVDLVEDSFMVTAAGEYSDYNIKGLIGALVVAMVNIACAFVTLLFIGFLCKAFKECQSPFEDKVIKAMRNLAIALIPWAFMSSISDGVATAFVMGHGANISINANIAVVCSVLIIFALTFVFKYGAMLQQESDETL